MRIVSRYAGRGGCLVGGDARGFVAPREHSGEAKVERQWRVAVDHVAGHAEGPGMRAVRDIDALATLGEPA